MPDQPLAMAQFELCLPLQPFTKAACTPAASYQQGRCSTIPPSVCSLNDWYCLLTQLASPVPSSSKQSSSLPQAWQKGSPCQLASHQEGKCTNYSHLWRLFSLTQICIWRYVNFSHPVPWRVSFLGEWEVWKCQNVLIWGQFVSKLHLTMLPYVIFLQALDFNKSAYAMTTASHRHPVMPHGCVILLATVHHGSINSRRRYELHWIRWRNCKVMDLDC